MFRKSGDNSKGVKRLQNAHQRSRRQREVERLYAELQSSHAELEARNAQLLTQATKMETLNRELLAMQNALEESYRSLERMNRQLEEHASVDAMTGLYNYRVFRERLATQMDLARRHGQSLSLLMLDVDDFKPYNDIHGHPAGDEVLRLVGNLLRSSLRASDIPVRYGGEEFAVILPYTELSTAEAAAERIRKSVAEHDFPCRQITLSIGVAALTAFTPDMEHLIIEADNALYEAKKTGKNRVISACVVGDRSGFQPERMDSIEGILDISATYFDEEGASDAKIPVPLHFPQLPPDVYGGVEGLLQETPGPVLTALLTALDLRDQEARGHSLRVTRYALRLAYALAVVYDQRRMDQPLVPWITPNDLHTLALGGLLHDIGNIRLPDYLLRKTGHLTENEWKVLRRHPYIGAEVLREFGMLSPALPVVLYHHERWDGTGYPEGLSGDDIPLAARIFSVCDALESITSDQAYRRGLPLSSAREEIARHAGTQFDPVIVDAFLTVPEADWERLRTSASPASSVPAAA